MLTKAFAQISMKPLVGLQIPLVLSALVSTLHREMGESRNIALGLPGLRAGADRQLGNRVHIFSDSQDNLAEKLTILQAQPALRDVLSIGDVARFDNDWTGPRVAYCRFRVKNAPKPGVSHREARLLARVRQLEQSRQLPFIDLMGLSTGHKVTIILQKLEYAGGLSGLGHLDSYGFSTRSQPVWLPDFR